VTGSAISGEIWLQGRSVVAGVAMGSIHFLHPEQEISFHASKIEKSGAEVEIQRSRPLWIGVKRTPSSFAKN